MTSRAAAICALVLLCVPPALAQESRPAIPEPAGFERLAQGGEKDRLAALFYLEDSRSADVAAWRLLLARRDDPRFLARVVRGLGRVGEPDLRPLLGEILASDGPWPRELQQAAALAVGLFGDPALLPALWEKAGPRDAFFAAGLMKQLPSGVRDRFLAWKEPEAAEEPAPGLGSSIEDPVEAALRWGAVLDDAAFLHLANRTLANAGASAGRRTAAVDYFARSKAKAPADLRPALAALLRSADPELMGLAARALAKAEGAGDSDAAAIEAAFVGGTDAVARVDAARALASLPIPRSHQALSTMLVLTKSDPAARRTVLESLLAVADELPGDTRKLVVATLVGIIEPGEGEAPARADVVAAVVRLLAVLDAKEFQARLPAFRLSAPWPVRAAAATALAAFDNHPVTPQLLADPDRRVRIASLEAIARSPRKLIASEAVCDPVETACEVRTVDLAEARTLPLLRLASQRIPHHEVEALQSVLDVAGGTRSDEGNAILRGYLKSPEISLRKRARELLSKNGIQAAEEPPRDDAGSRRMLEACVARAGRLVDNPFPTAVIETNLGNVTITLFPSDAPATVENFLRLAKAGFYDGMLWHRVVPAFVAQAGCPRGDGWGGPGWTVRCEVTDRAYRRGSIGMALAGKDTGGSQFFICHRALPHLDGRYTHFGWVAEGMDVVDRLGQDDFIVRIRDR